MSIAFISCDLQLKHDQKVDDVGNGYRITNMYGHYYYIRDDTDTIGGRIKISFHISKYAFTNQYIIAEQKLVDSIRKVEDFYNLTMCNFNKRIEESNICKYWIIDKLSSRNRNPILRRDSNILGPYNNKELLQMFDSLHIPDSIWSDSLVHRTYLKTEEDKPHPLSPLGILNYILKN